MTDPVIPTASAFRELAATMAASPVNAEVVLTPQAAAELYNAIADLLDRVHALETEKPDEPDPGEPQLRVVGS